MSISIFNPTVALTILLIFLCSAVPIIKTLLLLDDIFLIGKFLTNGTGITSNFLSLIK